MLGVHVKPTEKIMRIACVTRHRYPTAQEIRVTKFGETLNQCGYTFVVLCPGNQSDSRRDCFPHGQIYRLVPMQNRMLRLLFAPLPINPLWLVWLALQFRKLNIDLIIVRDLRLFLPALIAARLCGIRIILDLAEHYPGMMAIVGKEKATHWITRNRILIALLERLSVCLADVVFVVVEENRRRLLRYNSEIEVISNYPPAAEVRTDRKAIPLPYSKNGPPVSVISLGLIDNIRGLDLAIDSFRILLHELPNVKLMMYGDGPVRSTLEKRIKSLGLEENVVFGVWVSEENKYDILAQGHIGIILHKVCDLTQHTIPNKLFDYMSVGLPVISTRLNPVVRVIEKEKCGLTVDETPQAIAGALKRLILDDDARRQMGENGRKALLHSYRWEDEAQKFMSQVYGLLENRRNIPPNSDF